MDKYLLLYLSSIVFCLHSMAYQPGELVSVGTKKPISLAFRDPATYSSAASFIGRVNSQGQGNVGAVYRWNEGHLVKLIPAHSFGSGDEIEANRIAGELGVGPKIFDAWVTHKKDVPDQLFVVIEMEDLPGDTLGTLIPRGTRGKDYRELSELQRIYKNRDEQHNDSKTYFFDRFFTILKTLAEHKVSWADAHYGNFIHPSRRVSHGGELKIIDFDSAIIHETEKEAAIAILTAPYIKVWTYMFDGLSGQDKGEKARRALDALREMAGIPH